MVAVAKRAGELVIPDRLKTEGPTVFDRVKEALGGGPLWVVHRLDRDTSGVLLFARTAAAHRELSMAFEAGTVKKEYRALADGVPPAGVEEGRVDAPLATGRKGRVVVREDGKPSATRWKLLERFGSAHAWLALFPETGRTHQIRVHLQSIGLPIVGDRKYNFSKVTPVVGRMALHASSVEFLLGAKQHRVEAPLPEDLSRALDMLRR